LTGFLRDNRGLPMPLAERLVENYFQYQMLSAKDGSVLHSFASMFASDIPLRTIPVFDEDIFDLTGLSRINAFLFPRP
jgi:hypothetical protein